MALKKWLFALITLFLLSAAQAAEPVKYRLLLQVSEDNVDRMQVAITNAMRVQEEFGPANVEVEIVAYSGGIQTLKYYAPIPIADMVKEAYNEGIRFVVCESSMKSAKLKPSQMLPQVTYVRAGVAEIMEKVDQGWIYVRP